MTDAAENFAGKVGLQRPKIYAYAKELFLVAFGGRMLRMTSGARVIAQHMACIGRPTKDRPANDRRDGLRSVGVATAARFARYVTGKSAQTVGLHPSLALGLHCTEAACRWRRWHQSPCRSYGAME